MGKHFKIRTDHQPLKYMLDHKQIVPNQYAWLPKLMAYDFEIQYKQGKENIVANALSRVHSHGIMMHATSTVSTKLLERIKPTWQCASLECTGLKQGNSVPPYSWSQDCLMRKGKLVVGKDLDVRAQLLQHFHNSLVEGHSGIHATYYKLAIILY